MNNLTTGRPVLVDGGCHAHALMSSVMGRQTTTCRAVSRRLVVAGWKREIMPIARMSTQPAAPAGRSLLIFQFEVVKCSGYLLYFQFGARLYPEFIQTADFIRVGYLDIHVHPSTVNQ